MQRETEGRERPVALTPEELKEAAAGRSEQVLERRAKPLALSEAELKEAAAGRSEQIHVKKGQK